MHTLIDFSDRNYSSPFVEGKGAWYLEGAEGWVDVTVDFNSTQISFTGVDIEHASFVSTMIDDASVRPNDFDTSAISFDGDLEFVYSVKDEQRPDLRLRRARDVHRQRLRSHGQLQPWRRSSARLP